MADFEGSPQGHRERATGHEPGDAAPGGGGSEWRARRRRDLDDERAAVAFHEAGHSVIAHALGLDIVGAVTIKPNPDRGYVGAASVKLDGSPASVVAMLLAGEFAEHRARLWGLAPASPPAGEAAPRESRLAVAASAIAISPPIMRDDEDLLAAALARTPEAQAVRWRIVARTHELLDDLWPAVLRVADALLERETLTAAQVRQLSEGSTA